MVSRKQKKFLAVVCRHDCSAVPNVGHITLLSDYQHNYCTGTRTFVYGLNFVSEL